MGRSLSNDRKKPGTQGNVKLQVNVAGFLWAAASVTVLSRWTHTGQAIMRRPPPRPLSLHGSHRGGSVVLSVTRDVMGAARSAQTGITLREKVAPTLLLNSCVCDHVVSFLL